MYVLPCESKSAVTVRRRFLMHGRELLKKKFPSESGKSCSIRPIEFVEKEISVNCKSLELRRMNFKQLLFAIQVNQAITQLSTPQSTVHKILRYL